MEVNDSIWKLEDNINRPTDSIWKLEDDINSSTEGSGMSLYIHFLNKNTKNICIINANID